MNHLFKLLSGYIRLRLTGRSPERFFNLCGASGFPGLPAFCEEGGGPGADSGKKGTSFFFTPQQGAGGLGRGICGFFSVPVRDVFFCVGYWV